MQDWSLPTLLTGLHQDIQHRLETVRGSFAHPVTKGDGTESVWLELLQTYLPLRYQAEEAHVVDSRGHFSDQIDVVIFDRQYSPFIFSYQGQRIIPAESVYAVFEAKQALNAENVDYAERKVASVRCLYRTSLPIPAADRTYPAKPPIPIIGGLLTLNSDWIPPLGDALHTALNRGDEMQRLDLGCVAACGRFKSDSATSPYQFFSEEHAATAFLFDLITRLQFSGTVPMIDVQAYASWLSKTD